MPQRHGAGRDSPWGRYGGHRGSEKITVKPWGAARITPGYRWHPSNIARHREFNVCGALAGLWDQDTNKKTGKLQFEQPSLKGILMDNHSTKGKSGLIRELIAKGLSIHQPEKAVNAVFDCMTRAVRRGETVEIPGGTIRPRS
jgi:hypothetical protein